MTAENAVRRVLLAAASLWAVMSLTYPLGWDQGILSWAGDVVLRGGTPYRDAWDMKGPIVYYVFALTQAVFGVSLWGIRLTDGVLLIAATACVGRAVTRLMGANTGRWAAILFFLWYASHSYWHTAQPDGWVGMLLAVLFLPRFVQSRPLTTAAAVGIGIGIGLTSLVKPIYTVLLLLPALYSLSVEDRRPIRTMSAVAAGWLLPITLCIAWFASRGALGDLIAVYLRYPATAYADLGRMPLSDRARGLIEYFFQAPVMAVGLPAAIAGALALWRTHRPVALVLVVWMLLTFSIVVLQGRFFAYHWLPMLPAAVLLIVAGLHDVWPRARVLVLATAALLIALVLAPVAWEEARFVSWIAGRIGTAAYYDGYGNAGNEMRAVEWLQKSGRDGKVFVFGWNTGIAWLSRRETISRFGFSMPLLIGPETGIRAEYRDEVLQELRADLPRFIIVGTQSSRILRRPMTVGDFPAFAELLDNSYTKVAEFGDILIHERVTSLAWRR